MSTELAKQLRDLRERLSTLEQQLAQAVRWATVVQIQASPLRVKVQYDEQSTSGWLPITQAAAGQRRAWLPPSINEQVLVLAEGGNPNLAVAIAGVNCIEFAAPSSQLHAPLFSFADGAVVSYNEQTHVMHFELPSNGHYKMIGNINHIGFFDNSAGIKSAADISDQKRSMQADRDIYNSHDHTSPESGAKTSQTDAQQ